MENQAESDSGFALTVQYLPVNDAILVLGQLAGGLEDGWFESDQVLSLFDAFRLPRPQSIRRSLGQLLARKLVLATPNGIKWALTPVGERRAASTIGGFKYEEISAELAQIPGAEFSQARHGILPPSLAPTRWAAAIARLLGRFPFETNVFLMTRFPTGDAESTWKDPLAGVIDTLRAVSASHGLKLHMASDRQIEDDLWGNVGGYIWASRFGIGILETKAQESTEINDNVLIELGSMLTLGRRCMIIKDLDSPSPPTDISGQIYKPVNLEDVEQVASVTHLWYSEDLNLGSCADCPN